MVHAAAPGALSGAPPHALVALLAAAGATGGPWHGVASAAAAAVADSLGRAGPAAGLLSPSRRAQLLHAALDAPAVPRQPPTTSEHAAAATGGSSLPAEDANADADGASGGGGGGEAGVRARALSAVAAPRLRRVASTAKRLTLLQSASVLRGSGDRGSGTDGSSANVSGEPAEGVDTAVAAGRLAAAGGGALAAVAAGLVADAAPLLPPRTLLTLMLRLGRSGAAATLCTVPSPASAAGDRALDRATSDRDTDNATADNAGNASADAPSPLPAWAWASDDGLRAAPHALPPAASLLPRLCLLASMRLPQFGDAGVVALLEAVAACDASPGLLLRDACVRLLPRVPAMPAPLLA
eukprot:365780-Chlamydomonas_euryale.AAC.3